MAKKISDAPNLMGVVPQASETRKPENGLSGNGSNGNPELIEETQEEIWEEEEGETGERELEKKSLNLSAEAVSQLQQIKLGTKIPNDVMVDAVFRNWGKLPTRTQEMLLKAAREERDRRILQGQEKGLKTMQEKMKRRKR